MSSEIGNRKTVWVVFNDTRKDFSKALEFGALKDVFSSLGKVYNPEALVEHARHVLSSYKEGDYLLVVGDPTLVGICMVVLSEKNETFNVLRWDRDNFKYVSMPLYFPWD